jgi:hypothetical protein
VICGCAQHYPSSVLDSPASELYEKGLPYGFFSGLWHGFLVPFTLFYLLFSFLYGVGVMGLPASDFSLYGIHFYGTPNTGVGYWVGFSLPTLAAIFSGSRQ